MGQYYYAVSSLPQLYYDSESYPPRENFLQLCAENLSASDLNTMVQMDNGAGGNRRASLLQEWFDWNLSLRVELAILRAQRAGTNIEEYQGAEKISGTEEIAREAFNQESPLAAEEVLERARWAVLEELEVGHYFDLQKLLVYGLKISILERKSQFDMDSGLENFNRIYGAITEAKIGEQPE